MHHLNTPVLVAAPLVVARLRQAAVAVRKACLMFLALVATLPGVASLAACGGGDDEVNDEADATLIDVSGSVVIFASNPAASTADAVTVGALDAMAATTGSVVTIGSTTSAEAGAFAMTGVDVASQQGLILIVDDAPTNGGAYAYERATAAAGTYFPMITPIAGYMPSAASPTPATKENVTSAKVYALTNTLLGAWQAAAGLGDLTSSGFALGLVVNQATGEPIAGATVSSYTYGTIAVAYLESSGGALTSTGPSGVFITNDAVLTEPTLQKLSQGALAVSATVTGYTCTNGVAVVSPGMAFLVPILCTAN